MDALRLVGVVFGMLLFAATLGYRLRAGNLRNLDVILIALVSAAVVLVSVVPDSLNGVLGFFSFEEGGGGRILGLLVFSNFLLYLLILKLAVRTNRVDRSIAQLVREIAKREFSRDNPGGEGAPIIVVLPAYNEGPSIGDVLASMPSHAHGLAVEAIVVVDGGTDDTEEVVRSLNVPVATHVINRGGGAALRAGYDLAVERGAEVIVTMDADGQHVPGEISNLVKPIFDGDADLVNGSRVLGHYEKDNRVRAGGVVLFSALVSLLTWHRITDCSNGFRAIRATEVGKLELRQQQFHTTELLIEALKNGLRVVEVPITIQRRTSGTSKKPSTLPYGWGFAKAIITTWLR